MFSHCARLGIFSNLLTIACFPFPVINILNRQLDVCQRDQLLAEKQDKCFTQSTGQLREKMRQLIKAVGTRANSELPLAVRGKAATVS